MSTPNDAETIAADLPELNAAAYAQYQAHLEADDPEVAEYPEDAGELERVA